MILDDYYIFDQLSIGFFMKDSLLNKVVFIVANFLMLWC